jgi:hypothetical protein
VNRGQWLNGHVAYRARGRAVGRVAKTVKRKGRRWEGVRIMGGRSEETSTEEAEGANDRQDMGRVGEWESTCPVCANKSKPLKLFSSHIPSPFPSATSSANQDDLLNVPSLYVHIATHIDHGLRGKGKQLPYPHRTPCAADR